VNFVTFWEDISSSFNFRRFRALICVLWEDGNSRQQIATGMSWIVQPWHRPHFAYDSMVHPTTSVLLFPAFTRHGEMDACCLELTYHSEITRAFCSGGKGPPPATRTEASQGLPRWGVWKNTADHSVRAVACKPTLRRCSVLATFYCFLQAECLFWPAPEIFFW